MENPRGCGDLRTPRRAAVFAAFFLFLVVGTLGSPIKNRKSGGSSAFSLFNLKEKSRFWSDSVLLGRNFDDLKAFSPGKWAAYNYSKAANIANYLELLEVEFLYVPMPVNFIFIGFEGKGNEEFNLYAEELERWFAHIDHVFAHTRVPQLAEVQTPFYKAIMNKVEQNHLPLVSHVKYNLSVHAVLTDEKVSSVFEHAINALAHKDDVSDGGSDPALWQVDVDMIDILFSSFIDYLHLKNAYNIFVLNPKLDKRLARYGYRRGLSKSEIDFLRQNNSLHQKIVQAKGLPKIVLDLDKIKRPLYEKHPMAKFTWTKTGDTDTVEWVNIIKNTIDYLEKLYQGNDIADIIESKVLLLLSKEGDYMKALLEKQLQQGNLSGLHSECLTDAWIGKERWAFIDLSAGPFSWGPAVGGEGVHTGLPNVTKTIGAVAELSEDEAEDRLQEAIQERFSIFGDKDHQAIDILLAEIDIYELFAFKHCKGRKVKLALCEELDERMRDLKSELQSFEGEETDEVNRGKAVDALKRMESWNLFSSEHEDFQNYTVARDTFLAHLGTTLKGSMRHIISPSTADGSFHYYEKVSFQLFFVTQEKVTNAKQLPVDLTALEEGLSSLILPSQTVKFSQHMLPLSEDPAIAMAFSVARRAAAVPFLLVNGTYRQSVRSYIDSFILQYQLQKLHGHSSLKGMHSNSRSVLEVPIFWFFNTEPLFVDKHYQAKSLSDMVIVVQSEPSSWESYLQCNGQSLLWDLRMPIKAAVAATAEHLAGLIPHHIVYSHAHGAAIEDWLWSVGCNPFSVTSQGWRLSQLHSDAIARSYIISGLDESIELVNSGVRRLVGEHTTEKTYEVFRSHEKELVSKYNSVINLWRSISANSGELRYLDNLRLMNTLEAESRGFVQLVNATIAAIHPVQCAKQRKVQIIWDMTTVPAFLVLAGVLFIVLKPKRPKPKIN
ncbi:hypothetical protein MLD38_005968 [Melastoma candidum]|uniref:Uncharacterized protein n=1 Tax=Melastoma candidum TaxID=119954 RepID=A0ACB9RNB8_9MYRT|nr:hypothetical protein MLD38_005968 [Melastoma candidum]